MVSGFSDYRSPVGMANENCRSVLRCKNSLGNRDIVLQRYRRVLDDAHLVAVPLQDQKSSHPRGTVPPSGSLQDTCADGASVGNRVGWRPELVCPNWTDSAHPLRSFVVQAEKRAAAEANPCGLSKWRCGPGAGLSGAGR